MASHSQAALAVAFQRLLAVSVIFMAVISLPGANSQGKGSCIDRGITVCCRADNCPQQISPDGCFCDENCRRHGDCCDDIDQLCPRESCTEESIRLAGGSSDKEGRVEVCLNGVWGTVCHRNWSNVDARVVCGQLGHPNTGASAVRNSRFSQGNGPIHLNYVLCTGNETSIFDCSYTNSTSDCNHGTDAGVICGRAVCQDGQVRLVNGAYPSQGRVEVCLGGVWGSVCDNAWDRTDAEVVCRQLNMTSSRILAVGRAHFGSASEAINMNDVQCTGTESRLIDCKYNENSECTHSKDAGVFCGVRLGCLDGSVRLVNGTNSSEGRVEICVGSSWRTICDNGWDAYAARVICRQSGYPSAGALPFNGSMFGPGSSDYSVYYTNVTCTGHEMSLFGCSYQMTNSSICPHTRDAGVRCLPGPAECTDGSVRLADGADDYSGRVEVCLFERWGTVCDHSWSTAHAEVICRQLNLPTIGAIAFSGAYYGIGRGPIHIDDAQCTGDEPNITQCTFTSNDNCQHSNDASVRCSCNHGDIRLVGGSSALEGRVEVCLAGVWGTVTDDNWDSFDSDVVCRQLGFFGNVSFPILFAGFGRGVGPIHLDSVLCRGTESRLIDCFYDPNTSEDSHAEDAGVICTDGVPGATCTTGDVRLSNGYSDRDGRVEVCANDEWGTICNIAWDSFDAGVVCSSLGYANIGTPTPVGFLAKPGRGSGPILMSFVGCSGTEASIFDCFYLDTVNFLCRSHFVDVGVVCYESQGCVDGNVRLVGGPLSNEGRVEICYNGVWSTVSSSLWDQREAVVVCRQLGFFPYVGLPRLNAQYGRGHNNQPIAMHQVLCNGREEKLRECLFRPRPLTGVSHRNDAGVECFTNYDPSIGPGITPNCTAGSLRLVGGNTEMEGRVEVCLNGQWGTVCDDRLNSNSANVICRQLGYTGYGSVALPEAYYGEGDGPIYLDDLICTGHESNWWECGYYTAQHNCRHNEDASVRCRPRECTDGQIRLTGGQNEYEGRLEVCLNGTWGTVCDDFWAGNDAVVACRQLGYSDTFALGYNSAFFGGSTSLPILMDNLHCIGNETVLTDCPHETHTADCSHDEDAGIKCYPMPGSGDFNNSVCTQGDIRLVNGSRDNEGRIEVCIDNVWGTVCDDRFHPVDALVACRQLGFSDLFGVTPVLGGAYGAGSGPIYMDNTFCFGQEEKLLDCLFDPHTSDCTHERDVGVICSRSDECVTGDIRLVNGSIPTEGRVEICYNGVWGTITGVGFDINDARVACRQLGYDGNYALTYGYSQRAYFGEGTGPVHMHNVVCTGDEPSLLNCTFSGLPYNIINPHVADTGVRCFNTSGSVCTPGDIRLANGSSQLEGRIEMCFDGVWGTLCGIVWLEIDSHVVCRQLGYNDYTALTLPNGYYGLGNSSNSSSVPIYFTPICTGRENRLIECGHYQVSSCDHGDDTAIRCFTSDSCTEGSLRLVNGSSMYSGRVEICQHGVWGTVCDDFMSAIDARIVCRTLGFNERFAVSFVGGYYGSGTGPIHIDDLACTGTERTLIDCPYDSRTDDCDHSNDAGVACYNRSQCVSGTIRLVGGNNSYEGRLEFCRNNIWGTVCGSNFGVLDAIVVCRQLNLETEYAVPYSSAYYGRGVSEIVADNINCNGGENSLGRCRYNDATNCGHGQDVGVACYPNAQCNVTGQVRLVGGEDEYEGRVELCLNGVWGTVAHNFFDSRDATVVCRSIGYSTIGAEYFPRAYFGQGAGRVHMNFLRCVGNETNLTQCRYNRVVTSASHVGDIGVRCYSQGQCTNGQVRLANGPSQQEGRVEICRNSSWGTIARVGWTQTNSRVICGSLGYSNKIAFSASYGAGQGPIFFRSVSCNGSEESIFNCSYSTSTAFYSHFFDVGVKCFNKTISGDCINGDIRLAGSNSQTEGRVEICAEGVWYMVCDNGWSQNDANVACRQLGFGEAGNQPRYASFYGHNSGEYLVEGVGCDGTESRLVDCLVDATPQCSLLDTAGVVCSLRNCTEGAVRLRGLGSSSSQGRVEICIGGVWSTVCDSQWDTTDSRVVCRQLGYSDITAVAVPNAYFGLGSGPIQMNRVRCNGAESGLINCTYSSNAAGCTHGRDAGVKCFSSNVSGNCSLGDVRLRGGVRDNEGRVEVCMNGVWGTVCDESWSTVDAVVLCSQLGYRPIATSFIGSYFQPANGPIYMNRVYCTGSERYLVHCLYEDNVIGCDHQKEAGVRCFQTDNCTHGEVRLVNNRLNSSNTVSSVVREGRLEMCYNGVWATIYGRTWSSRIQTPLACQELGFPPTTLSYRTIYGGDYGHTNRPIIIVNCQLTRPRLSNCYVSLTSSIATHNLDVGVYCPPPPCTDGTVRLRNGSTATQGRVEICLNNTWGSISDWQWSYNDGKVVCRQLGYSDILLRVRSGVYFGRGRRPILFTSFRCRGSESNLLSCSYSNDTRGSSPNRVAGIECYSNDQCTHGALRLANGTSSEGRLEVCLRGVWGSISNLGWTFYEARVACGQLGFSRRYALTADGSNYSPPYLPIVAFNVFCFDTEQYLVNCSHIPLVLFTNGSQTAGVRCYSQQAGNCTLGEIRLTGGSTPYEGTVEICIGGEWGTVCDHSWSRRDAIVTCRQLGYSETGAAVRLSSYFTNITSGPIFMTRLFCSGAEANLLQCSHSPFTQSCTHENDAGVICYPGNECIHGEVRLAGNSGLEYEGRVEVCVNGVWGTVCHDLWSQNDAMVVCRQLELPYQFPVPIREGYFGSTNHPIVLNGLICTGNEDNLTSCSSTYSTNFCTHSYDVGVACLNQSRCVHGESRFFNGNSTAGGTLEVCLNGVWGTVCDDAWNTEDSRVACRSMGLTANFSKPYHNAHYGRGNGPIFLTRLRCQGDESNLTECQHSQEVNCVHAEDAGLQCLPQAECEKEGQIKLVNGSNPAEGRLEVCLDGVWGTVTDDLWDTITAGVICKILGYTNQASLYTRAYYGRGAGPIHLDNVVCLGSETSILNCDYSRNTEGDSHAEDVGIRCVTAVNNCTLGDVRLVGGDSPSEGRVEVCVDGLWGTIDDYDWDSNSAKVVCRQLGYSDRVVLLYDNAYFGQGTGAIALEYLYCEGTEKNILDCFYLKFPTYSSHYDDAGVKCFNDSDVGACTAGDVRLVGGTNSSGIVEVCFDGEWGTLCGSGFGSNVTAEVICGQLGFARDGSSIVTSASTVFTGSRDTTGPIYMTSLSCYGSEKDIVSCDHNGDTSDCVHSQDLGVMCTLTDCTPGDVRLINGSTPLEGRVEICESGKWGTVCDDSWDHRDAQVICRQLGYSGDYALPYHLNVFSGANISIIASFFGCYGNETEWSMCPYSSGINFYCTHEEDAGVKCFNNIITPGSCSNGEVRLINGSGSYEGRVEVCIFGNWTTVCDKYWGFQEAEIVCKQLGYDSTEASIFKRSYFGAGNGTINLGGVNCRGNEYNILNCSHTATALDCDHTDDVGVRCIVGTECNTTGDVRLRDGSTPLMGRVEVCYRGLWQSINTRVWSRQNSRTICRQLGYSGLFAQSITPTPGNGAMYTGYFGCSSRDTKLLDCSWSRDYNTEITDDIGISCYRNVSINCTLGTVRLSNGSGERNGRPEICWNGIDWVPIVTSYYLSDVEQARVICVHLGYGGIGSKFINNSFTVSSNTSVRINLCYGKEPSIFDCGYNLQTSTSQTSNYVVQCTLPVSNCTDGDIRLVDGSTERDGRVEICYGSTWGTINDYGAYIYEANVICRQLGYSDTSNRIYLDYSSNSTLPVAFTHTFCYGYEERLFDCLLVHWSFSVPYSYPIGVSCSPKVVGTTSSIAMATTVMSSLPIPTISTAYTARASSSLITMATSRASSSSISMATSTVSLSVTMATSTASSSSITMATSTASSSSVSMATSTASSSVTMATSTASSSSITMATSTASVTMATSTSRSSRLIVVTPTVLTPSVTMVTSTTTPIPSTTATTTGVSSLVRVQPSNVRSISLTATVPGSSTTLNRSAFKGAVANSVNRFCESGQCQRKRQATPRVSSDDVIIVSVTDTDGRMVMIQFYVQTVGSTPMDITNLENAVKAGIDSGLFRNAGFSNMSIQRTTPSIIASPSAGKSSSGMSSAGFVGIAVALLIVIVIICSIVVLLTIFWLRRRANSYDVQKDLLVNSASGTFSNRSSCVDIEVPGALKEQQVLSEKELEKFEEALKESTTESAENVKETAAL